MFFQSRLTVNLIMFMIGHSSVVALPVDIILDAQQIVGHGLQRELMQDRWHRIKAPIQDEQLSTRLVWTLKASEQTHSRIWLKEVSCVGTSSTPVTGNIRCYSRCLLWFRVCCTLCHMQYSLGHLSLYLIDLCFLNKCIYQWCHTVQTDVGPVLYDSWRSLMTLCEYNVFPGLYPKARNTSILYTTYSVLVIDQHIPLPW